MKILFFFQFDTFLSGFVILTDVRKVLRMLKLGFQSLTKLNFLMAAGKIVIWSPAVVVCNQIIDGQVFIKLVTVTC